jgi:hypothetical protein
MKSSFLAYSGKSVVKSALRKAWLALATEASSHGPHE